jgi:hypothetical protein
MGDRSWEIGAGSWKLGVGSWGIRAGSWEIGAGSLGIEYRGLGQKFEGYLLGSSEGESALLEEIADQREEFGKGSPRAQ